MGGVDGAAQGGRGVRRVAAFTNAEPIESKYLLGEIFVQFDTDGDGVLEPERVQARDARDRPGEAQGDKANLDEFTFKSMDTNGRRQAHRAGVRRQRAARAARAKLEAKLAEGWKFDEEKWKASQARHAKWNMAKVFKKFDVDDDGFLELGELKRAFRALGLKKRSGEDLEIDEKTFKSFDTNGDGKVSLEEFEANLHEKTRAKIEEKLNGDWKFDPELWNASIERHAQPNFAKIFKLFDADGDGFLDLRELKRAFRAIGLKKRDGQQVRARPVDLQVDGRQRRRQDLARGVPEQHAAAAAREAQRGRRGRLAVRRGEVEGVARTPRRRRALPDVSKAY